MQVVINISEDDLDAIKYLKVKGWASRHELLILNGTPLPKGHGKLIDADALYADLTFPTQQFAKAFHEILDDAQPIIPADKDGD